MTAEDERLHDLSFENEALLKSAARCGCYYCGRIFKPSEISEWLNDSHGRTALCPYCGMDTILQEASDGSYNLDVNLLQHMNSLWFGIDGIILDVTDVE